jgi:hypothetical protein
MDKEVEEYLENLSKLLNSSLRGSINLKAREENLELIQITFRDIYNELESYLYNKMKTDKKDD